MILVTGGAGFIGTHLVDSLAARGLPVRCLLRPKKVRRRMPQAEIAAGDLLTGAGVEAALDGVDTVIHLAGVTKALAADEYYAGNARATETLARALAGRDLRFVHVSSLAAVGPSPDGSPLDEDATPRPLTHYGRSKLEAERIVRELAPRAVIVRPPVVYGPGDTDVFQLLKSISRGLLLEIAGGERWFSAIYVKDLAGGLIAAAQCPQAAGRTYFLTHAKPATWRELGDAAGRIMNRRPRVLRVPVALARVVGLCAETWARVTRRPGIVSREKIAEAICPFWTCDSRRAARELGFEARTSLETGLAETLAWYKEAGWLSY